MAIKLKSSGGADFDPIPAGAHQAVCYGIVDIGTQKSQDPQYKPARKLALLFELPHERGNFGEGKENLPRGAVSTYTQSLSEKAALRRILESWRGRAFTEQELEGFDPKVLVGVNCQLNIIHKKKGDKTFANINNIMPLAKGMTKMPMENKSLYFSLDDQADLSNIQYPENMPNWLKEKIAFSEEAMAASGHHPEPEQQQQGDSAQANAAHSKENLDEDVPF